MRLGDLFLEAVTALRANRLRSFLTLLGIIIGVATIVGVVGVIAGLDGYVKEKVFNLSPDVFVVTKFGIIRSREEFLDALKRKRLDMREYERLRPLLAEASATAASDSRRGAAKRGDRRLPDLAIVGTTASFGQVNNVDLAAGRYFIDGEVRTRQAVAVVGWDIKEELFPQLDPIGRQITINGVPFTVIGLVPKKGRVLGRNEDGRIYIPISSFRQFYGETDNFNILIKARGGVAGVERSTDEVRAVLRALRHTDFRAPDPFGLVSSEQLMTLWAQISGAAFLLMILISSVSLGVGGIVITNIMLVAVLERTQEIGVRKAIGASERDIQRQFLLEAALLSLGGGVVGVLIGSGAALSVKNFLDFPAVVTPTIVLVGIGLSVVVGIASGYFPARNAARMNAIDALRAD